MSDFVNYPFDRVTLQALVLNQKGSSISQPAGYPKIRINRINNSTITHILNTSSLTHDQNGEYFYNWTAPSTLGFYKVRYEALINNVVVSGYDSVKVIDYANTEYLVVGE
jgi:hypothetical protein